MSMKVIRTPETNILKIENLIREVYPTMLDVTYEGAIGYSLKAEYKFTAHLPDGVNKEIRIINP